MNTWLLFFLSIYLISLSCHSSRKKIFEAIQEEFNPAKQITIFDNYEYVIKRNDSILEEGRAQLTGQKLILSPKPQSPFKTLIINHEFAIIANRLCAIRYLQQNSDSSKMLLVKPVPEINEHDCYLISSH
jgi:hypothetical protein